MLNSADKHVCIMNVVQDTNGSKEILVAKHLKSLLMFRVLK